MSRSRANEIAFGAVTIAVDGRWSAPPFGAATSAAGGEPGPLAAPAPATSPVPGMPEPGAGCLASGGLVSLIGRAYTRPRRPDCGPAVTGPSRFAGRVQAEVGPLHVPPRPVPGRPGRPAAPGNAVSRAQVRCDGRDGRI